MCDSLSFHLSTLPIPSQWTFPQGKTYIFIYFRIPNPPTVVTEYKLHFSKYFSESFCFACAQALRNSPWNKSNRNSVYIAKYFHPRKEQKKKINRFDIFLHGKFFLNNLYGIEFSSYDLIWCWVIYGWDKSPDKWYELYKMDHPNSQYSFYSFQFIVFISSFCP